MAELTIRSALDAIETKINRGEHGDALAILQNTRDALTVESEPALVDGSIAERVYSVRDDLFTVMALAEIIRRAVSADTEWCLYRTAQVTVAQIDAACAALELIAIDARDPQEVHHERHE